MKSWVSILLVLSVVSCSHTSAEAQVPPPPDVPAQGETVVRQTAEQLQQLVAPIALYPDELVAQILAASTYPTEIVEADRWVQEHSNLKGQALAQAVDPQSWDPSVKAVAQFPSVLANMDKNLSWTSALGDAYVNQQQDVLDAVQTMRQRAQQAGNLKSTPQEKVAAQGDTIVIQPANPDVVYVPVYDPWVVYGPGLIAYPGWFWYPGLYAVGPGISFGVGFGIGFFGGFGWGWHHWGADWHHHHILYDHHGWESHSRTFIDHDHFYRGGPGFHGSPGFHGDHGFHAGGGARGGPDFHGGSGGGFHGGSGPAGFHGGPGPAAAPHVDPGTHSGAFSGFGHGGPTASSSARGQGSFGGGGFHGGGFGGGFHGGGGSHGGGGHR